MRELDFKLMKLWVPEALDIQAMVNTWSKQYGVEPERINQKIMDAYVWAEANKKRFKRPMRFIHNYLSNCKKWGNLEPGEKKAPAFGKPPKELEPEMTPEEMEEIRRTNFPQFRPDSAKLKDAVETKAEK